jgi:hypothetical protein
MVARLARLFCPLTLFLVCFGPVLARDRQFGFRDAADFYYPLHLRVQQEWQAGRLPLWEPEENAGTPLLGNPAAAVLYPGKLIYAVLPYPWAARVYVIAHSALSYAAMLLLMRGWGLSPAASTLAALGYAFGGPVLLQYCNVIFLVGAAWMPLAFYFGDRWLLRREYRAACALALVLCMQCLGGDPEAAYVSVCALGAYVLGLALVTRGRLQTRRLALGVFGILLVYVSLLSWKLWAEPLGSGTGKAWSPSAERLAALGWAAAVTAVFLRWLRRGRTWGLEGRLLGLAGSALLALLIGAIQVIPVLEFISLSHRGSGGQTPASIYDFSIHPARLAEALWPNLFGTISQGNHRWLEALPPTFDYQIWLESLYVGGPILILGLAATSLRRGPARRVWLTATALIALAAGLGPYGSPRFWAGSLSAAPADGSAESAPGPSDQNGISSPSGVGGVYWFMATALPGFSAFRYPGKLLVLASLALCALAACGWDELVRAGPRRAFRLASTCLAVTLTALLLLKLPSGRERMIRFLDLHPDLTTTVFGPLQTAGAVADSSEALLHAAVVLSACLPLFRWSRRSPGPSGIAIVCLIAADLGVAHAPLIHTVPQQIFEARPKALEMIERAELKNPAEGPYRIHRMPNWAPAAWLNQGAASRIETIVRWERDSLRPKYAITEGSSYTLTKGTVELADYLAFFDILRIRLDEATSRRHGFSSGYEVVYHTRRGYDLWNTRYFILPARLALGSRFRGVLSFLPRTTEIDPQPGAFEGPDGDRLRNIWLREHDVQILRNEAAFPRAWIVHRARFQEPITSQIPAALKRTMDEILYQDDELWHEDGRKVHDPRALAWLEVASARREDIGRRLSGANPDPAEFVRVELYQPQRVELSALLRSTGLVVLADTYYPGWELCIDGLPASIVRTNRAMRGALVPAGSHRLVYTYRPRSLVWGGALSTIGIAICIGLFVPRIPCSKRRETFC